jgi:hypothetical protein
MALPVLVRQLVDVKLSKYCAAKIPARVKDEIKLLHKARGNSVTILESRPLFSDPNVWIDTVVAQFRFKPEDKTWTLYCADRNSKWHRYDLADPSTNLDDLLAAVDEDATCIFWG